MLERFLTALSGRSALLVPLSLGLVLVAGVLTARAGPPAWPSTEPARPVEPAEWPGARLGAPNPTAPTASAPVAATAVAVPTEALTPTPAPSPTPTAEPTSTPTPVPRIRPTPTTDPAAWRGRALTDVIIREEPKIDSLPMGLLLNGELAYIDEVVTGQDVIPGNPTWYRVHSGEMAGFVYGSLFEPDPRPGGGQ